MLSWLTRFRRHAASVLCHLAWGAYAGAVGASDPVNGAALLSGGYAYQFGSAWRKAETSRVDTVGLDSFDYALGYAVGYHGARAGLWGI